MECELAHRIAADMLGLERVGQMHEDLFDTINQAASLVKTVKDDLTDTQTIASIIVGWKQGTGHSVAPDMEAEEKRLKEMRGRGFSMDS